MAIPICLCMTNVGKGLGCPAHGGAYELPKTECVLAAWGRVNEGPSVDELDALNVARWQATLTRRTTKPPPCDEG